VSKRAFDLCAGGAALALLAPLMAALALWVRLDSRGPALSREQRLGRDGVLFLLVQFRTLADAPGGSGPPPHPSLHPLAGTGAGAGDHRLTRAGRLLRRYHLDKLPQLFNVLQGTMSLVGRAPEVPEAVASYPLALRTRVLEFVPGMMDWTCALEPEERALLRGAVDPAQVWLDAILPARLDYYACYCRQRSLRLDLRIILHSLTTLAG
jgi:lipopolysaccharide/colanic/teichoic acid biosynthesis glycosyltransferase